MRTLQTVGVSMLPTWIVFVPIALVYGGGVLVWLLRKILGLRQPTSEELAQLRRIEAESEETKEKTE